MRPNFKYYNQQFIKQLPLCSIEQFLHKSKLIIGYTCSV